jgi:hypothetical protein
LGSGVPNVRRAPVVGGQRMRVDPRCHVSLGDRWVISLPTSGSREIQPLDQGGTSASRSLNFRIRRNPGALSRSYFRSHTVRSLNCRS